MNTFPKILAFAGSARKGSSNKLVINEAARIAKESIWSTPLGQKGGDRPDHAAPNMDHVCFQVQPWDTSTIQGHLEQHGIASGDVASRYGASGMGPSVYLRDPEGNTVELKGSRPLP